MTGDLLRIIMTGLYQVHPIQMYGYNEKGEPSNSVFIEVNEAFTRELPEVKKLVICVVGSFAEGRIVRLLTLNPRPNWYIGLKNRVIPR
jgi:hypothetical protein